MFVLWLHIFGLKSVLPFDILQEIHVYISLYIYFITSGPGCGISNG